MKVARKLLHSDNYISTSLKKCLIVSLFFVLTTSALMAQDETKAADNLLKQQRSQLLSLMAFSDDPAEQRLAVQRFSQLIDSGDLSQNDEIIVTTLLRLAQQGTAYKVFDKNGNLTNENYVVRADACNLFGKLGGPLASAALVSIMVNDIDPVVVAIAVENLLKANPDGSPNLLERMITVFYRYHYTNPDNTLANALLLVVAQYGANSQGKLLSPRILQAVHEISLPSNAYARTIRTQARSLILNWIGGSYPSLDKVK